MPLDPPDRGRYTSLSGVQLGKTLARKLIPVVDTLRDLRTKFGMRPYEVAVVRVRWTGGTRGQGEEYVVSRRPILPTPRLVDMSSLTEVVSPVGVDEVGPVTLDEISGRYTEAFLSCKDEDGGEVDDDLNVFYEVVFPEADSSAAPRRRFYPISAPHYASGKFEWSLRLERARPDYEQGTAP